MGIEDTANETVDDVVDGKEPAEATVLDENDQAQSRIQTQSRSQSQSGGSEPGQGEDEGDGEGESETSVMETVIDTVADEIAADANMAAGFDPEISNIVNEAIAKV